MKVWIIVSKEGYAREYHSAYMSEKVANRIVREMNVAIKKEKYEVIGVQVDG